MSTNISFQTQLPNLTIHAEIQDLLYRTVTGIDTNDWNLFSSAWTSQHDAAVFEMNGERTQSLQKIRDTMFATVGPLDTTHFITNVRVNLAGEGAQTASVTSYALAQHYRKGEGIRMDLGSSRANLLSGSMYDLDVVKEEGVWKIKEWRMKIIWVEGDRSVMSG